MIKGSNEQRQGKGVSTFGLDAHELGGGSSSDEDEQDKADEQQLFRILQKLKHVSPI
jgi:hypothetical protein